MMVQGREGVEWGRASLLASILWAHYRSQFERGKAPKQLTQADFVPDWLKRQTPAEREADRKMAFAAMRAAFTRKKKPCSR